MSTRRNSLIIHAERATIALAPHVLGQAPQVTITVSSPSVDDLVRLIAEASALLEHHRRSCNILIKKPETL